MRSTVIFNIHVLILSASVFVAGCSLIREKQETESDSQSAEELDLHLAIAEELADLTGKHPAPHPAPRKTKALALAQQQSSGRLSDLSQAVEDLDLNLAIHAELAQVKATPVQAHWQKPALVLPHQNAHKERAFAEAHLAAALLQSGHNALQGIKRSSVVEAATSKEATVKHDQDDDGEDLLFGYAIASAGSRSAATASTAPLPRTASSMVSSAVPVHIAHTAKVAAVHISHIVQRAQVSEPMASPAAFPAPHDARARFEPWMSGYTFRKHEFSTYYMRGFISVLLWAALTLLIGCFYHHEKQHPPKMDPEGVNVSLHDRERLDRQRWRFGLFECTEMPSLCLFAFFCAPIRWADTMRMAGFMNFFSALSLVVGLTVLGSMTLGVGFVLVLGMCARFRHHMRKQFDIRSGLCGIYTDVLAYIFCPLCSIVQEARQVEEAYLARHASVRGEYIMARLAASKV